MRTEERYDPVAFGKLHERTFARQGKIPAPAIGEITVVMDNLHAAGRLRMFISSTAEDIPGSIAVFGTDSRRAYYLYGANEPDLRHSHTGTMVLWHGFAALSRDVREVDLEGVNSLARGYFKLSFGGSLTPYFGVSINTN